MLRNNEFSYITDGNVKKYNYFGEDFQFLTKLNMNFSHEPAILFLHIYSREINHVPTKIHTIMFISALFLIAKKWKEPKYPSVGEEINKMWYIHNGIPILIKKV